MERRAERRSEKYVTTVCRIPASPCAALIVDVSLSGCRLRILNRSFALGTTVHFEGGQAGPFTGEIVWVGDSVAGVKFHSPLTPEMARALRLDSGREGRDGTVAGAAAHLAEEPRANQLRRRLRGLAPS